VEFSADTTRMSAAPHADFIDAPSTTPPPGRRSGSGACPSTCRGSSSTPTWAAGIADHVRLYQGCVDIPPAEVENSDAALAEAGRSTA
jgi:hypothetical protein